jgi:hypothetical protein
MVEWTERASRVIAQPVLWDRPPGGRMAMRPVETVKPTAAVFLLVTAAICLPYVVGFA